VTTKDEARARAREIARESLARGDAIGWFETFYRDAGGDESKVPWADRRGHPLLVEWLARESARPRGCALVVGCGLGEDSEELARAGYDVTAFDVSPQAIEWCRARFAESRVRYSVADLFDLPRAWRRAFDLVVELYTLQALPLGLRERAVERIADLPAPGGSVLVVTRGRELAEPLDEVPWPLARSELNRFVRAGLREHAFEDLRDAGDPPSRHFRVEYRR
jgi:SAM-dependent methyltransferase